MKDKLPTVTVVIPTYNGEAFIADAIASVFDQTLLPTEIIVVDDCSRDGTAALVDQISRSAPVRLRLIRRTKNSGGPAVPINIGIAAASSDCVAVLDQDDAFVPNKLKQQLAVLSERPDVALVAGACAPWKDPDVAMPQQLAKFKELGGVGSTPGQTIHGTEFLRLLLLHGNVLLGYPAFMFRVSDWRAYGGVNERLRIGSDYDLLCWLTTRGQVVIDSLPCYRRRVHETNCTHDAQEMYLDAVRVQARYLSEQPWLARDLEVATCMRQWFTNYGFMLRQAGNYLGAWECYRATGQTWGWDRRLLRAAAMLLLHRGWRKLSGRPALYNDLTRLKPAPVPAP